MYAYMIYKIWSYVSICGANSFSKIYELVKKKASVSGMAKMLVRGSQETPRPHIPRQGIVDGLSAIQTKIRPIAEDTIHFGPGSEGIHQSQQWQNDTLKRCNGLILYSNGYH